MINEEIVTYLKGEEKFKDDYFIFEWAKYSSLIKKDKDPGQYLPYLFIIYYFGPNKMIQDAAKKLIDDISPKEILAFQEKFISSLRKLDAAIVKAFANDEDGDLRGDFVEIFDGAEDIMFPFSDVPDSFKWAKSYFEAFMLPISLISDNLSVSKITLEEVEYTHYYFDYSVEHGRKDPEEDTTLKKNYIFLNYCLNDKFLRGQNNFSNKTLGRVNANDFIDTAICWNVINYIAQTNLQAAADFLNDNSHGVGPIQPKHWEDDWPMSFEECINLIDKELTFEIRANHSFMDSPSLEETLNHNKLKDSNTSDKKGVTAAVTINGRALEGVPKELQADKEVVMAAVKQNGRALISASKELQADKEVVMVALKQDGSVLEYASKELQADKEVVLAAIKNSHTEFPDLSFVSKDILSDQQVIMASIKKNGDNIKYASKKMLSDKNFILLAIKEYIFLDYFNKQIFKHASKELQADKEVVMAVVKQNGWTLEYASKELQADKEVVMAAVKREGSLLEYASKKLQADKEVVMAAVKKGGWALKHASKEFQADKEVVMAAVKNCGWTLQYASKKLQADQELIALSKS